MVSITPTQANAQAALRSFLTAMLPDGTPIIAGQANRVAEPTDGSFVVMTPMRYRRLRTNGDTPDDSKFIGSIAAKVMTVSFVYHGRIVPGRQLFGVSVASGTKVGAQISGMPGGAGTYAVSIAQTLSPQTLAAGAEILEQGAEVTIQLDFHSADNTASDMAQIVSTALRDDFGVRFFGALAAPLNAVVPLHADDPRQMPFINENQQYEWRWVLEACLQVNDLVDVPQQFTDAVDVGLIEVDSHYPPTPPRVALTAQLASMAMARVPIGGGGDAFVLQLDGQNLQLSGQDLTLGA